VFFYIAIYIVWTSLQGHRFLVPIIPFIFYYFARALWLIPDVLRLFIKKPGDKYWVLGQRVIITGLAIAAIYGNWGADVSIIRNEHQKPYYAGSAANFLNAISWLRENTPLDAVVVSGRAPWVYMLSDRTTFSPPWVKNTEEVMASIRANDTSYIINSSILHSSTFLTPVLQEESGSFRKVHEVGDCAVYEVVVTD
jgi:hypothetical protein